MLGSWHSNNIHDDVHWFEIITIEPFVFHIHHVTSLRREVRVINTCYVILKHEENY